MRPISACATLLAALAVLVSAAPSLGFDFFNWSRTKHLPRPDSELCMTRAEAEIAADIFRQLIQEYSDDLALSALTEDFHDYASSVNIIINKGAAGPKSMNAPTFASRAAFIDGQGKQPEIPFTKIKVFPGCRHVAMRWKTGRSANGHSTEVDDIPVHGNAIIEVVPSEPGNIYNWRISHIWSEFNSAAWLVNLGVFKPGGTPLEAQDVTHMERFHEDVSAEELDSVRNTTSQTILKMQEQSFQRVLETSLAVVDIQSDL